MRVVLMLLLASSVQAAEPAELLTLRARAALALSMATPFAEASPSYAEQRAKALREGKPLVVWVGQPAKVVSGCVSVACASFPDAMRESVVIGVPEGDTLRRVDLAGRPADDAILSAVRDAMRSERRMAR